MFSLAGRLCSEGKRFWLRKCDFCHLYFILRGRGTHVDFLRFIIVSGRHYFPSDARAFSLTSLWNVKLFMRLNDGFRLFKFLQSASWIWIIISDFIFVPEMWRFPAMFCHAEPSSLASLAGWKIVTNSDQISKNGLQLTLKLHQLWRIEMCLSLDCS